MDRRQHPVLSVVAPLVITCSPPLRLDGDRAGKEHLRGQYVSGLSRDQYDTLKILCYRYYASVGGALDPLPTGVGKSTNYDRLGNKRHKPESAPPPKAADPDEPDWVMARLADAIEHRLEFAQKLLLAYRLGEERRPVAWCASQMGQTEDWVRLRWGRLVTWLYFRAHGLCE